MGQVGYYRSIDALRYPRLARVIVRTDRGLEIGEVLADLEQSPRPHTRHLDGWILRGMTVEDQLLEARLQQNRDAAYRSCATMLADRNLPVTLMDVEHLFDGQGLYFYFLGDAAPDLDDITDELARVYESKVNFRKFTEAVTQGCGPGCGTESASGSGCTSCGDGCALADACGRRDSSQTH